VSASALIVALISGDNRTNMLEAGPNSTEDLFDKILMAEQRFVIANMLT